MIARQQQRKASYSAFIFVAIVVGFGRWFLETSIGVAKANGLLPFAYAFYYIAVGLSFYIILRYIAGISGRASLNSARLGLLVGLLPPIIDLVRSSLTNTPLLNYSYYLYEDFRFFSPFFYDPNHGFPLGESIAIWFIIFMTFVLTVRETRNPVRIITALLSGYAVFLIFLVVLPKGVADLFTKDNLGLNLDLKLRMNSRNLTTQYHAYFYFGIIIIQLFVIDVHFRKAIRKRFFHYMPFGAIAAAPFVFTTNFGVLTFCVPALVMLNFLFACMQNDLYDSSLRKNAGSTQNLKRSMQYADVVQFFMILFFLLVAYLYGLGNLLFFPQLIFLLLTLLYNLPETRMRYYLLGGQKVEGGWGVCALWSALVCLKMNPFHISTLLFTILIFFGWAYISSVKDIKDILNDRHDGRSTLISFLHQKFGSLSRAAAVYKIQIGLLILVPVLFILLQKSVSGALFFFLFAIFPIWLILLYASRRSLFNYFSAGISLYFILYAYIAGY